MSTCQICGRTIKVNNTGLIAHHGYQLPSNGWQTASCRGARRQPYELGCDALPPAIVSCGEYIAHQQRLLTRLMTSPPELLISRFDGHPREFAFTKSNYFDALDHQPSHKRDTYTYQFDLRRREFAQRITDSRATLAYLNDRLANWKAAA